MDFQELAKAFKPGDTVQRMDPGSAMLSPYIGQVTQVHRGLGQVDVKWSDGSVDRITPDELVKVASSVAAWFPPELDLPLNEAARKRRASVSAKKLWGGSTLPAGFYTHLARAWAGGQTEIGAYDLVWHRFASEGADDRKLRSEVQKFYRVATRLMNLRVENAVHKNAAYWVAQNRQYRVSKGELESGKPCCPKCGTQMRKTTYKMAEGNRVRLYACPKDLFLVKSDSLLGPQGEPMGW